MEHTRKLHTWGGFLLLLVLLVAFLIWNLLAGSVRLPASEIWAVLHGGGDLPHRDPSRTDKDQRVHFRKRHAIDRFFKRQKSRLRQPRHRITKRFRLRQRHTDTPRRFASSAAVSENRNVHFVASRNSVVNEGS